MMNQEYDTQLRTEAALSILKHAVDTQDLNLAERALRVFKAIQRAENRLYNMAYAYKELGR
jgi:hypothetical protein